MSKTTVSIPEVKEILKTGLQFGHATSRWNPKMREFIFGSKGGVHVIDVIKTREQLESAAKFLEDASARGEVIFVGTKRQAAEIVKDHAQRTGAHFVTNRWPGGMLTNWNVVRNSLRRLQHLEEMFEEGVEGRTKYEISQLKSEWSRLERMYGGVKSLQSVPTAMVIIDPKYEKVAVREAQNMRVPVVALTDTNCDPSFIDYVIPGNDDALGSITLVMQVLGDAVLAGNKGEGVKHHLKDYSGVEVKIVKPVSQGEDQTEDNLVAKTTPVEEKKPAEKATPAKVSKKKSAMDKGMLELARERASKQAGKSK